MGFEPHGSKIGNFIKSSFSINVLGANEKINLAQVWKGVRVFGRFFQLMGDA